MEGECGEEKNRNDVEVYNSYDSDVDNSSNVEDRQNNCETEEEKIIDWAYNVMDWLVEAVKARAWNEIINNAEDIITAFLVLVKDEHRGIVMDTLRKIFSSWR